jgi:hypothetical protein
MLRLIISRFTVKLVVILALIFTTSCLTLKTIPTNNINQLQTLRKNLRIHSEDSVWTIYHYLINGKLLSGKIIRNKEGIGKLNTADIYVAPLNAVDIKGDILTVSTENIGKIDYQIPDALIVISSTGICMVLLLFALLFL